MVTFRATLGVRVKITSVETVSVVVVVKNFPECLLGEDAEALDNSQPLLLIDPSFWNEFNRNGFYQCVHRAQCASKKCLGLATAYTEKYGWHADALVPLLPAAK